MLDLKTLLHIPIAWQKTQESEYVFSTIVEGEEIRLRLNDFPEEPLCTVIWSGGEQDLEELGKGWTLPKHRGED